MKKLFSIAMIVPLLVVFVSAVAASPPTPIPLPDLVGSISISPNVPTPGQAATLTPNCLYVWLDTIVGEAGELPDLDIMVADVFCPKTLRFKIASPGGGTFRCPAYPQNFAVCNDYEVKWNDVQPGQYRVPLDGRPEDGPCAHLFDQNGQLIDYECLSWGPPPKP